MVNSQVWGSLDPRQHNEGGYATTGLSTLIYTVTTSKSSLQCNHLQLCQIQVVLTFDDSVNDLNQRLYQSIFHPIRRNPNGCPISATFYVSHLEDDIMMRFISNITQIDHKLGLIQLHDCAVCRHMCSV